MCSALINIGKALYKNQAFIIIYLFIYTGIHCSPRTATNLYDRSRRIFEGFDMITALYLQPIIYRCTNLLITWIFQLSVASDPVAYVLHKKSAPIYTFPFWYGSLLPGCHIEITSVIDKREPLYQTSVIVYRTSCC